MRNDVGQSFGTALNHFGENCSRCKDSKDNLETLGINLLCKRKIFCEVSGGKKIIGNWNFLFNIIAFDNL